MVMYDIFFWFGVWCAVSFLLGAVYAWARWR